MPHLKGTNLGGIRALEDIRVRCRVDPDTECWHWLLGRSEGVPKLHFWHPTTKQRTTGKGRRVALILARGKELPKGHVTWAKACCHSDDCVNPAHTRSGTKVEWGAWLSKTGKVKNLPSKAAGARRAWDVRGRKIDQATANMIRASEKSSRQLAEELGVSQFAVWSVRNGNSHHETMRAASVWTWGG